METRKHKFNIIDVVVILLAACAVAGIVIHFTSGKDRASKNRTTLSFVMETDKLSALFKDNVAPGDPIYDRDSGKMIGKVVSSEWRKWQYTGTDENGNPVVSGTDDFITLRITAEATDAEGTDEYKVAGVPVSTGREYTLMLPSLYCKAECIDVKVTAGEN